MELHLGKDSFQLVGTLDTNPITGYVEDGIFIFELHKDPAFQNNPDCNGWSVFGQAELNATFSVLTIYADGNFVEMVEPSGVNLAVH